MKKILLFFTFIITASSMQAQTVAYKTKVANDTLVRMKQMAKPIADTAIRRQGFIQYLVQHSKVAAVIAGMLNKN